MIEPLRDFHKDEVRVLGTQLGLPQDLVNRHPFPGMFTASWRNALPLPVRRHCTSKIFNVIAVQFNCCDTPFKGDGFPRMNESSNYETSEMSISKYFR